MAKNKNNLPALGWQVIHAIKSGLLHGKRNRFLSDVAITVCDSEGVLLRACLIAGSDIHIAVETILLGSADGLGLNA